METLAAECILECQFINRHVSVILPKEKHVSLSDGSIIPILWDSDPLTPPSSKEWLPLSLMGVGVVRQMKTASFFPTS
jgi:hypothetical protein